MEEKIAREKIRQQIAKDKEERRRKMMKNSGEGMSETSTQNVSKPSISLSNANNTMINFRLPNGSSIKKDFSAEQPLGE